MNQKNFRGFLILASLFGTLSFAAGGAAAEEPSCASEKCHAKLLSGKNVHPVAEDCGTCHDSVSTPHPKKGVKTFKLSEEVPGLCTTCHDKVGGKSTVHPPAKDGECTLCHDPHSSDEPALLAQPQKDLCGTCHGDHVDFKVVHGPVSAGACTACHAPHESDRKKLLLKDEEELCLGCHVDMADVVKKSNVHPALAMGCTSCHNPHGSANRKLLAEEGPKLCFQCHPEIGDTVSNATVPHPPVKSPAACASCHSPHASDNANMLLNPEKDTCLGCHGNIITKSMTNVHGPIREGKCTPCHNPHGGQNAHLLMKSFPTDAYVPYTGNEFALCFSCHKREMVQYPETSFATNFRDGERNLHYLHVNNKEKGRSCRLCHNIHGSSSPKLIAESVPFGKWTLPLRFNKTETGGSCAPGCHKPQHYDRKSPGKKPDMVKATP